MTIILYNYPPSTLQGVGLGGRKNPRIIVGENYFNSVHTRCIVKTSGFTRGVCKNRDFIKFKGFLVEFIENK